MPPPRPARLALTLALALALLLRPASAENPYIWIGNVTSTSFAVHVDIATVPSSGSASDLSTSNLLVGATEKDSSDLESLAISPKTDVFKPIGKPFPSPYDTIRIYKAAGLKPGVRYLFGFKTDDVIGSVITFPEAEDCDEVLLAVGSCQYFKGIFSTLKAWQQIAKLPKGTSSRAVLMVHGGDLHYKNIAENRPDKYFEATSDVVRNDKISDVFRSLPIAYMYDDHDSGGDNASGDSKSVPAVLDNYRRMVPHPVAKNTTFPEGKPPSYHAFTVGPVRFILTDLRTESSRADARLMNDKQLTWFLSELGAFNDFRVVVWLSTRPYISEEGTTMDDWGAMAPGQRRTIADFIADKSIKNMIQVSGDMHALAADSGQHSDYSKEGGAGFPVFQCGPLGNVGSTKGGPYDVDGCKSIRYYPVAQYATVRLSKLQSEDGPCVSYKGFRGGGKKPMISFEKCGTLGGVRGLKGGGQGPTCKITVFTWWEWLVLVLLVLLLLGCCGGGIWLCVSCCCGKNKGRKPQSTGAPPSPDAEAAGRVSDASGGSRSSSPSKAVRRRSKQEVDVEASPIALT